VGTKIFLRQGMNAELSTEEKIKQAARQVFMEKGYAGATTREIAEVAGINIALTNYYFRSKDKLFQLVYGEAFQDLFRILLDVLNSDLSLKDKMNRLIDEDVDFLLRNPELPGFVLGETHSNPEAFLKILSIKRDAFFASKFLTQVLQAQAQGQMRAINPLEIILTIVSNIQFFFLAKPIVKHLASLDEAQFKLFVLQHKQMVKDMLATYLFPNP
jgi:TetR/AcrR family transcriptional regulator